MREREVGRIETFGVRNNVIVLETETSAAVSESFADDVSGGVFSPPLGMSTGDDVGVWPALVLRLSIEESRPLRSVRFLIDARRRRRRRRRGRGGGVRERGGVRRYGGRDPHRVFNSRRFRFKLKYKPNRILFCYFLFEKFFGANQTQNEVYLLKY